MSLSSNDKIILTLLTFGILIMISVMLFFNNTSNIIPSNSLNINKYKVPIRDTTLPSLPTLPSNTQIVMPTIMSNINVPNIHIIHTSGNIEGTFKEDYTKYTKSKENIGNIGKYDIQTYSPYIKYSDNLPSDCNTIAKNIHNLYDKYDSFIIVCSSDILTYVASALSFILENLSKPVIVTSNNLLSTLISSSNTKIPEVMVFSQDKLLRGCSVINIGKDVFVSPKIGQLNQTNALQRPDGLFQVKPFNPQIKVSTVNESLINRVDGIDGVVIDSKGDGSSLLSPNTLERITNLMKKGTIVVIVLQDQQNINKSLASTGIIHCNDITATAASAKLNFLLSNVQDRKLIDQLMKKSFRGEMSNST